MDFNENFILGCSAIGAGLAVIAGIAMVKGLHMPVNTIGDLYTISNALPALTVPVFNFDMVQKLLPDAKNVGILY